MQKQRRKGSSLLPLQFFFLYGFFFLCVFLSFPLLEKKKMRRKKRLKQKGKNRRPEVVTKNEKAKCELEGKLLPFSTFLFFSMVFFLICFSFLFFCLFEKKKMSRESVYNKRVEARAKNERAEWELK
jgi:cellulose synthase/poly-beta-1,6-N-acetylglucosamine synthase-like glycosyltransferase